MFFWWDFQYSSTGRVYFSLMQKLQDLHHIYETSLIEGCDIGYTEGGHRNWWIITNHLVTVLAFVRKSPLDFNQDAKQTPSLVSPSAFLPNSSSTVLNLDTSTVFSIFMFESWSASNLSLIMSSLDSCYLNSINKAETWISIEWSEYSQIIFSLIFFQPGRWYCSLWVIIIHTVLTPHWLTPLFTLTLYQKMGFQRDFCRELLGSGISFIRINHFLKVGFQSNFHREYCKITLISST